MDTVLFQILEQEKRAPLPDKHILYQRGRKCATSSIRFLRDMGEWTQAQHKEWLAYYTYHWNRFRQCFPDEVFVHFYAGMVSVLKSSFCRPYSIDKELSL